MPERALSSYRGTVEATPEVDGTAERSLPDAGPTGLARPVDAGDAPEPLDVLAAEDAGVTLALVCREECACEPGEDGEVMFCPTPVSHDDAVERCALAGGSLPSVDDPERNRWLSARMLALEADDFWLSGTDAEDEGIWRWADGRVFFEVSADAGATRPFTAWEDGQPNDLDGEDCMRSTGGLWRDLDCSEAIAYVCER